MRPGGGQTSGCGGPLLLCTRPGVRPLRRGAGVPDSPAPGERSARYRPGARGQRSHLGKQASIDPAGEALGDAAVHLFAGHRETDHGYRRGRVCLESGAEGREGLARAQRHLERTHDATVICRFHRARPRRDRGRPVGHGDQSPWSGPRRARLSRADLMAGKRAGNRRSSTTARR